jgi:ketosteroid isomerase-like protein
LALTATIRGRILASDHEETVRAFFKAVERNDFETLAKLVSPDYIARDHTTDFVARTREELRAAQEEDSAWSDRQFVIDRVMDTSDGTLVVQITNTQTLTGEWRSVKGTGQRVRREILEIFEFDSEGRIVVEEFYDDALSVMRQLGALG